MRPPARGSPPRRVRLKLRHVFFTLFLLAGLVPLISILVVLLPPTKALLNDQEESALIGSADAVSRDLDGLLMGVRRELQALGDGLLAAPGPRRTERRLEQPWVRETLQTFADRHRHWRRFLVANRDGTGPQFAGQGQTSAALLEALRSAFDGALGGELQHRFVELGPTEHAIVVSVPVGEDPAEPELVLSAVVEPPPGLSEDPLADEAAETNEVAAPGQAATFLLDRRGGLIWSNVEDPRRRDAFLASSIPETFVQRPMVMTQEGSAEIDGRQVESLIRVSPISETGWGVVVQKPKSAAYKTVRRMTVTAVVTTAVLVLLALGVAYLGSSWLGRPIQRLARATHAVAAGDFESRVDTEGLHLELKDLAEDFNLMGGYVQSSIEHLENAAKANRELFIGSLRAFTAAIDAKDPYTRGHSERVAGVSRTIARHIGQEDEFQNRLWIAALLHDVGKIGVEDRILRKGGVLTPDEYEQMKLHTVIGAEIMASIEQVRDAVPVIRWHHENWNGRGYPDGLKGEQIPLMARIVAVADTFDAITTSRPYQNAYTLDYAVETITQLTGSRFDAKVVTAFLRAVEMGEVAAAEAPGEPSSPDAEPGGPPPVAAVG